MGGCTSPNTSENWFPTLSDKRPCVFKAVQRPVAKVHIRTCWAFWKFNRSPGAKKVDNFATERPKFRLD